MPESIGSSACFPVGAIPDCALPTISGRWGGETPERVGSSVGLTIINFNTATQTLRCLESLRKVVDPPAWILVLDNASNREDYERLLGGCCPIASSELRLYRSDTNLGFAAGSNFLIDQLLTDPACSLIGLLNNDAVAMPKMLAHLAGALADGALRVGMAGGRMHKLHAPDQVDTLGITMYASLMPADRRSVSDPYLGPTGGCCLMTRELVEDLKLASGYCFDPRFFCYCEDTDLVLRANLLGYRPAYVDEVVALHEGQASTGGGYSPFIAYHGIRNSIWMQMKLLPTRMLLRNGLMLACAHAMTIIRHAFAGHGGLLVAVYRDAFRQRKTFREEHKKFQQHVRIGPGVLARRFSPRFYRSGYARLALSQLWANLCSKWRSSPTRP